MNKVYCIHEVGLNDLSLASVRAISCQSGQKNGGNLADMKNCENLISSVSLTEIMTFFFLRKNPIRKRSEEFLCKISTQYLNTTAHTAIKEEHDCQSLL